MDELRLGIDVGSSFVKVAVQNGGPEPEAQDYFAHNGDPHGALASRLAIVPETPFHLGLTGSGASLLSDRFSISPVHTVQAEVAAVRERFPEVRNIINVGAGSSTIIHLDEGGEFRNYAANSLCAAGTGSFLDEQARRLGIDYDQISEDDFDEDPPAVASRCAVFAKSDLIHRQQEGYGPKAMWAGLCKGCVDTFLQTLLKGKPLDGLTVMTGGVTKNALVMRWLRRYYGDTIVTWEGAHLAGAIGAARLANGAALTPDLFCEVMGADGGRTEKPVKRGRCLVLNKSDYPSFDVAAEEVDEHGSEIRVWRTLEPGTVGVYLGIDIGSTSTKLVVLDEARGVILDIYRKTLGDPLTAVRRLFAAVERFQEETGVRFDVRRCATTGSGRKFIGQIIGADRVINEISAHVRGAMETDPEIDTIFEIGGQDSKYMRTVGGSIRDANMNFICAAGTGSFVEEQAGKLGYRVAEVGDRVMGTAPPETSDRCTVFMEEDVSRLLRQGFDKTEVMAGVLNSVVKNYLNKVVGGRPVSRDKVFFQGATARNKGLVAAFENLLDVQVVVSPLCHQMGSYGVALIVADEAAQSNEASTFRGFDLHRRPVELRKEQCELCHNQCRITFAHIEGVDEEPSWGYMCGKEPGAEKRKVNYAYRLFRRRKKLLQHEYKNQTVAADAPVVTLPRSLTTYSLLPFWTALMNGLGRRVELTDATDEEIKKAGTISAPGDFCFPIKVALGHGLKAGETGGDLLMPHVISARPNAHTTNSLYCPYVQSMPSVVRSVMQVKGIETGRFLTPVFDLRWNEKLLLNEFNKSLGGPLGATRKQVRRALKKAQAAQAAFESACREEGEKALAELADKGEKAIVIAGRPYNCFDPGANIGLPEKISEYGYTVVPVDFVPFDPKDLGEEYRNTYWNYGQRILGAAKVASERENLFLVYLTNFNCGPDSFLLTYAERILGDKPLLILELDEHGADAGYLTRVEAFLDVVGKYKEPPRPAADATRAAPLSEFKKRTLWLPPMHPLAGQIGEGVFERFGYHARALPPEDREAYEIGRKVVRGNECLPTSVTIGGLIKKLREIDAKPGEHAFMMATATGPCRFGQYEHLHRLILDREGFADVPILSPSSINSYQGLDQKMRKVLWYAFLAADVVFKMQCKIRPYEKHAGHTNQVTYKAVRMLRETFAKGRNLEEAVRSVAADFAAIPRYEENKPLVGVVGEIYVRCNPYSNGYVIDHIERYGGEAWLAPLSEWFLYTAYLQKWSADQGLRGFTARGLSILKNRFLFKSEHDMYSWCGDVLADRHEPPVDEVVKEGEKYLPINFEGEAIITLGRAIKFAEQGASLVVNCAPFGCMPGTLTSAIFQEIEVETGVPVVSMYYDGDSDINRQLEVYLSEAGQSKPRSDAV